MPVPSMLKRLRLPVIGAPMFLVSGPDLVIAQCRSGIVGSFPALNARPQEVLDEWLGRIEAALTPDDPPFAVNLILNRANQRLPQDIATVLRHKVPVVITSLQAPTEIVPQVHAYGGLVFHDVTTVRHAEKAAEAGVDGLILVCAGAGGHAGILSPFALLKEVRRFFSGTIILAGAITDGRGVLAAQAMGADLIYMGTRFIATQESLAHPDYKQMVVDSQAKDVVYTPFFSGIPANYLRPSIARAGLDPEEIANAPKGQYKTGAQRAESKAWKDIWGAGQGVGGIDDIPPVAELVKRLDAEYQAAREELRARL